MFLQTSQDSARDRSDFNRFGADRLELGFDAVDESLDYHVDGVDEVILIRFRFWGGVE